VGVGFLWGALTTLQRAREDWGRRVQDLSQRQPSASSELETQTSLNMKETLLPYHAPVPRRSRVDTVARWMFGIAAVTFLITWVCSS
jgi:hypothetical protein